MSEPTRRARDELGPRTFADDGRRWGPPNQGWPLATASGGFGLDKGAPIAVSLRQEVDGQERASRPNLKPRVRDEQPHISLDSKSPIRARS
jgi:hypothetical protein